MAEPSAPQPTRRYEVSSRKKWIIGLAPLVVIAWLVVLAAAFGGSTDAKITTPDATPVVAHTPAPPAAPAAPASSRRPRRRASRTRGSRPEDYLSTMPFSRTELIQQLESSAGDGFTAAQAEYGVNAAYTS